jgi:parvulin-like peptidyl-prolyl isomerase
MASAIPAPDHPLDTETLEALVRRLELKPVLLKRLEEEAITALVALPEPWIQAQLDELLSGTTAEQFQQQRGWSDADLRLHVARPEALRRFAEQRFGPGLEEQFLAARGAHDQIIYSLLRSRDQALVRELWIRIEEAETTFAEAAQTFGEGPEAGRKGLIGPLTMGQLAPPQLAEILRRLQPGRVSAPLQLGEWTVLLRLEQLTPARFDATMRSTLLQQNLNDFLEERVKRRLAGQPLDPLTYHHDA